MPSEENGQRRGVQRLWRHRAFNQCLRRSLHNVELCTAVVDCVERLRENPQHPGLNLETIDRVDGHRVLSARIDQQYRLILAEVSPGELALLYFDNHDEAYQWAAGARRRIARMLADLNELPPGPLRFVEQADDDMPILLESLEAFRAWVVDGLGPYLMRLDDDQQRLVRLDERSGSTPIVIYGSAGTGKTALGVARAIHLASRPEAGYGPVLLLCYNRVLRNVLEDLIRAAVDGSALEGEIEVRTVHEWAHGYLGDEADVIPADTATRDGLAYDIGRVFRERPELAARLSSIRPGEVAEEIWSVIFGSGLTSVDEYLEIERRGRRYPLRREQRTAVWDVLEAVRQGFGGKLFIEEIPRVAAERVQHDQEFEAYRAVIVDEGQDFDPTMVRLAKALTGGDHRRLYFLADPAQSIYDHGFYWTQRELLPGGRRPTRLGRQYRTTRQIDALVASLADDSAGEVDRDGPRPRLHVVRSHDELVDELASMVKDECAGETGWRHEYVAVIAPGRPALKAYREALVEFDVPVRTIDSQQGSLALAHPSVKLIHLHASKGLDFPVVYLADFTPVGISRGSEEAEQRSQARAQLFVALTRSSYQLTIISDLEHVDEALYKLDPSSYDLSGDAAEAFMRERSVRQANQ